MLASLTVAIAGAAVALLFLVVADLPAYGIGPRIPWWALAVAFGVTELFVVHAHVRGSAHSLSLSELPLILGLLLATPQDLVIAQFAGPALVLAFSRRNSPIKLVFNLAQFGLTACLAVVTLHALAPVTEGLGPQLWFATFAAVTVSALSGATLVFAAITLAEGVIPSRRLALMMGVDLLVSLTNTSVGLAGATLVAQDSRAGWLLIAPAVHPAARLPRVSLRAHPPREPGLPLRRRPLALARARHRDGAGRPAGAHARLVPRRGGRDRAALGRRHAAAHRAGHGRRGAHAADRAVARRGAARVRAGGAGGARAPGGCVRGAGALPVGARDLGGARRPGAGRDPADGRDGAGRPRRRRVLVQRRGRAAVRDARQPRGDVSGVRPHARPAGAARAPGVPRLAVRARQPGAVPAPAGGVAAPRGRDDDRAVPRPGRLQGDQRRARARRGRRRAGGGRRPPARRRAPWRPRRPAGRRRVRGAARGQRRRARRGGRRARARLAVAAGARGRAGVDARVGRHRLRPVRVGRAPTS